MQDANALAAALRSLRRRQGLRQEDVAERMGRSSATVSRLEQDGVNPQWLTLMRYLEAIEVDLTDLVDELAESAASVRRPDALDKQLEREAKRIETEPGYRRLAAEMLRRFGGDELPPGMLAFAELLDQHGERIESLERERKLGPGGEEGPPNGTDGGPIEG